MQSEAGRKKKEEGSQQERKKDTKKQRKNGEMSLNVKDGTWYTDTVDLYIYINVCALEDGPWLLSLETTFHNFPKNITAFVSSASNDYVNHQIIPMAILVSFTRSITVT